LYREQHNDSHEPVFSFAFELLLAAAGGFLGASLLATLSRSNVRSALISLPDNDVDLKNLAVAVYCIGVFIGAGALLIDALKVPSSAENNDQ